MQIKVIPVGPIQTNCYFLIEETTRCAALIDPGDDWEVLHKLVEKEKVNLQYILLTHGHYDHTTAVPELHKQYPDTKIYIHEADANGAGTHLFPLCGQVEGLCHYDEGDTLSLGSLTVEVMHTPGHSPGSVVLKVDDVLFCGDTLFAGSCGRTDLRGGSYDQIMQSLKRLGELEGNFHVLPGHEFTSDLEQERKTNPYLREAMGK